jgi:hypothetical protein
MARSARSSRGRPIERCVPDSLLSVICDFQNSVVS